MKKFVFTALSAALMLIGSNAFAQFSVNAGFTNSALKEIRHQQLLDRFEGTTKANGFYFGGDYNIKLGKGFGIAPGVEWIYVMDNNVKNFDALVATVKGETKFKEHYINVPVDVNWGIDLKILRVYVFAGPTFSFNVSSKTKATAGALGKEVTKEYDTKDLFGEYKNFDLMLGGGVGVDLFNKIRVKCGYDWGLMNRGNSDGAGDLELHRQQLRVGVGFIF